MGSSKKQSSEMWRGCVYFIRFGRNGPIKIGFGADPLARLSNLQVAHFEPLHLLGWVEATIISERFWHEHFAHCRIRGEWFSPAPDLLAEIEKAIGVRPDSAICSGEHAPGLM